MQLNNLISIAGRKLMATGQVSNSKFWQGTENLNPLFQAIKVYLGPAMMPESTQELINLTKPNQPWADAHFDERVGGIPLNPGESYKLWPFYGSDEKMRNEGQQFSHTYMERIWPRGAGVYTDDAMKHIPSGPRNYVHDEHQNMGIRYLFGDLNDLIELLVKDPETRQAYLPIWYPEDTGAVHGGRVPCTLGYLFQIVNGYLHMTYYIRSCDYVRHFRDDIYLAVRLCQFILLSLKLKDSKFSQVRPGLFDAHIGSLHCFNIEVNKIRKELGL